MIKNILLICRDWLIKFMGGYTEEDLILERAEVRLTYIDQVNRAEENYRKATERIRHMLELEVFGYTKQERIQARRDDFINSMCKAVREEAVEFFNRWEDLDSKPVTGVRRGR